MYNFSKMGTIFWVTREPHKNIFRIYNDCTTYNIELKKSVLKVEFPEKRIYKFLANTNVKCLKQVWISFKRLNLRFADLKFMNKNGLFKV